MANYLIKILITLLFSVLIAFFYYNINISHIENFDWYIGYLIPIVIIYGIYKYFKTKYPKIEILIIIILVNGFSFLIVEFIRYALSYYPLFPIF